MTNRILPSLVFGVVSTIYSQSAMSQCAAFVRPTLTINVFESTTQQSLNIDIANTHAYLRDPEQISVELGPKIEAVQLRSNSIFIDPEQTVMHIAFKITKPGYWPLVDRIFREPDVSCDAKNDFSIDVYMCPIGTACI
ncbi:MAG: hypothetical protein MI864_17860 [Pseudomonadales bacterium]|nr:hypothetical protein [Pseudomonadales bacterium]